MEDTMIEQQSRPRLTSNRIAPQLTTVEQGWAQYQQLIELRFEEMNRMPRRMLLDYGIDLAELSPPVAEAPPLVVPTTRLLDAPAVSSDLEFLREYQQLAAKIGYHCAEAVQTLTEADLAAFLHEEAMPVYNYDAVVKYMGDMVARMNAEAGSGWDRKRHAWRWAGVRKCDIRTDRAGGLLVAPYTKPIPMPVLMTVAKLVEKFNERVRIQVSDIYTMPKPDPFLAVSAPGGRKFVIERWDEPSFRG